MKKQIIIAIIMLIVNIASAQTSIVIDNTTYSLSVPSQITGPFDYQIMASNTKIWEENTYIIPQITKTVNDKILVNKLQSQPVIILDTDGTKLLEKLIVDSIGFSKGYETTNEYVVINDTLRKYIYGIDVDGVEKTAIESFDINLNKISHQEFNGIISSGNGNNNNGTDTTNTNGTDTTNSTSGVNEYEKIQFSIYPNPTTESINISGIDEVQIQIVNETGHIVLKTNDTNINVSNLSTGVYFCRIQTPKGLGIKTFIKN